MDKDTLSIVFLYVEINQYYKLKKKYNLDVLNYCKNVHLDMGYVIRYGHIEVFQYLVLKAH